MKRLLLLAAIGVMASPTWSFGAVDYFPVTIDGAFNINPAEGYTNSGAQYFRLAKADHHMAYMDWDGSVGDLTGMTLPDFLAANPDVSCAHLYLRDFSNQFCWCDGECYDYLGGTIALISMRTGNAGNIVEDRGTSCCARYWAPAPGFTGATEAVAWRGATVPYPGFVLVGDGITPDGTAYIAPSGREPGMGYPPYLFGPGDTIWYEDGGPGMSGLFRGWNATQGMWALEDILGFASSQSQTTVERFYGAGQLVNGAGPDGNGMPILLAPANCAAFFGGHEPRDAAGDGDSSMGWYKVEISLDLLMDIAFNPENKGIVFTTWTAFTTTYGNYNTEILSRETWGGLWAAYLAIETGPRDCNGNGVPDADDIAAGTSQDCNANRVPDECDIEAHTSQDSNADGIPDECQTAPDIAPIADAAVLEGQSYQATPTLLKGTPPITWSLLAGPPGMTIDGSTGAVSWPYPAPVGTQATVTVRADNAYGSDEISWIVRVGALPVISAVNASPSAFVTWITDRAASSQVEYGTTEAYGSMSPLDPVLVTSHGVNLGGLAPETLYHFRVRSKDAFGFEAVSQDQTFVTAAAPNLQVTAIAAPVEAWTGQRIDVSWTVANTGRGDASGNWVDRVYLSADTQPGNDRFLGEFPLTGGMPAGQSLTRTQVVTIPDSRLTEGDYYIVVVTDAGNAVQEADESDNALVNSLPTRVRIRPLPDLRVTQVTAPGIANAGQTVGVSWTICNNGDGATDASYWHEHVYLSPDTDPSHAIRDYGTFLNGSYLAPGECYTETHDLALPCGITGSHYFIVKTDVDHRVTEGNESNNEGCTVAPTNVSYVDCGFLHVEPVVVAPAPPATVWAGQQVNVTWTLKNTGSSTIVASGGYPYIDSSIILSQEPNGTTGHEYFHQGTRVSSIRSGESVPSTASITLPNDIFGTWYVVILPDRGGFTGDVPKDMDSAPIEVVLPPPADLHVSTVEANVAGPGQPIYVAWTVTNNGPNATNGGAWNDAVYLSADTTLDTSADTLIGTFSHSGVLDREVSYSKTVDIPAPAGVTGPYYVFVCTDRDNRIYEVPYEGNNSNYDPTPVQIVLAPPRPLPDLQVTVLSVSGTPAAGQPLIVSWTVQNNGVGPTVEGSWNDKIYLSSYETLDPARDTPLGTYGHTGDLAVAAPYVQAQAVTMPRGISGPYYLFVVCDADNRAAESAEANNTRRTDTAIQVAPGQYPDLVPGSLNLPATADAGQPLAISWTVTNGGEDVAAGAWVDIAYLSTDTALDPSNDIRLGVFWHSGDLDGGASYTQVQSPVLPVNLAGSLYLIVVTDSDNAVYEAAAEGNNIAASDTRVQVGIATWPDLQVPTVDAPDSAYSAQQATISWTVVNNGTVAMPAATTWYDTVYLSKDQILDLATDQKLGAFSRPNWLAPGQSYTQSVLIEIPKGASGPYYVFVVTDSTNVVFEHTSEGNNVGRDPWAVVVSLAPPADLVVTDIVVPASGTPGQPTTITWTVTNQGLNAATGQWTDSVYLSADTMWDINDLLVGRKDHGGTVAAPGSYTETLPAPLPAATPGAYYVIVRADIRNNVRESNETNNAGPSAGTIEIRVPELTLGVPATGQLSTGTEHYYKVNVPAGEDLLITLDSESTDSANELYVRYGAVPDRGHYDFLYDKPLEPNQEVTVPTTQAGWYYILVLGDNVPGGRTGYDILASIQEFGIASVKPDHGANSAGVAVTIHGFKFSDGLTVQLRNATTVVSPERVVVPESIRAVAWFDLDGVPAGTYDVVVIGSDARSDVLSGGYTIQAEATLSLTVDVPTTNVGTPGRGTPLLLRFHNTGNVDIPSAAIVITMPPGCVGSIRAPSWDGSGAGESRGEQVTLFVSGLCVGAIGSAQLTVWAAAPGSYSLDVCTYLLPGPGVSAFSSTPRILAGEPMAVLSGQDITCPPAPEPGTILFQLDAENLLTGKGHEAFMGPGGYVLDKVDKKLIPPDGGYRRVPWNQWWHDTQVWNKDGTIKTRGYIVYWERPDITADKVAQIDALWRDLESLTATAPNDPSIRFDWFNKCTEAMADILKRVGVFHPRVFPWTTPAELAYLYTGKDLGGLLSSPQWWWGYSVILNDLIPDYDLLRQLELLEYYRISYRARFRVIAAQDPNEKIGPQGHGNEALIEAQAPMLYAVLFENIPSATAPAQTIRIADALDASLDARSFRLNEIVFGDHTITVPANRSYYQTRIDLGPDHDNMMADVSAGLDVAKGEVFWTMSIVDPATGEQPENPLIGLLPPNDPATHCGEGHVTYTIKPKAGLPTGTVIRNKATIIFDNNEPIDTNEVCNTIDADLPTSALDPLPAESADPHILLTWSGQDPPGGSGLADFTIYVSTDGGPYSVFLASTPDTTAVFSGRSGHSYRFYSIARDNAENTEPVPTDGSGHVVPDATTRVGVLAGDIDGNGTINALDLQRVINCVLQIPPTLSAPQRYAADVSGDGCITEEDVDLVTQYILGNITSFPVELHGREHWAVPVCGGCAGDCDGDGDVDIFDVIDTVLAFGSEPGDPNWDPRCDFDGNGIVDVFDVIDVVTNFGTGT